jgi:hypothetical protein
MRSQFRSAFSKLTPALLLLAACYTADYGPGEDPEEPTDQRILSWFGEGLIAVINDTSIALQARVESTDGQSTSIPGVVVTWEVISGPGQMIVVNDTTDGVGISRARYLATADTGTRVVVARIGGTSDSALFHIRALPPCPVGAVTVGQTIDSALVGGEQCNNANYDLSAGAGQAYFLTYTHHPDPAQGGVDGLDPLIALWEGVAGRPVQFGRDPFLAVSDDEGEGKNAELFFVAPESVNLRLQLFTFGGPNARGGYRLKVEACPTIAVTADPGTATHTLPAIAADTCLRHHNGVTSAYRFLSLPVQAGEEITIGIASTDFVPVWDAFPNWGSFGPTGGEVGTVIGSGGARTVTVFEDGLITIAVGGNTPIAAGEFTLTIARATAAAPPVPRDQRGR